MHRSPPQGDNGGGLYTKDVNCSVFTSTFRGNTAFGNGGAASLENNLDTLINEVFVVNNTANVLSGGVYMSTTPFVRVTASNFTSNRARRNAGAMSVIACNCVLITDVGLDGNSAAARGGAIHLQPPGPDNGFVTNALADQAACAGTFMKDIRRAASPVGLGLLGTLDVPFATYNATVAYKLATSLVFGVQVTTDDVVGGGPFFLPAVTNMAGLLTHLPVSPAPISADQIYSYCSANLFESQGFENLTLYDRNAGIAYLAARASEAGFAAPGFVPGLAAALYPSFGDTSGYNATLMLDRDANANSIGGIPYDAPLVCRAITAPANALVRGLSALLINVRANGNSAGLKGGAIVLDGGIGRVLFDRLSLVGNTVARGDGGAFALFQDDDQQAMTMQAIFTSSVMMGNQAVRGDGGAMSIDADELLQQVGGGGRGGGVARCGAGRGRAACGQAAAAATR